MERGGLKASGKILVWMPGQIGLFLLPLHWIVDAQDCLYCFHTLPLACQTECWRLLRCVHVLCAIKGM